MRRSPAREITRVLSYQAAAAVLDGAARHPCCANYEVEPNPVSLVYPSGRLVSAKSCAPSSISRCRALKARLQSIAAIESR